MDACLLHAHDLPSPRVHAAAARVALLTAPSLLPLKYSLDPRANEDPDHGKNNPLSLAEDSPWRSYYEDLELRDVIDRVRRPCRLPAVACRVALRQPSPAAPPRRT